MAWTEQTISFPGLGIGQIDPPQYFMLFGFPIHFYGVIIAVGFLLAFLYGFKRVRQFGLTSDELTDAILFGVPIGILCARLYYVIFEWQNYAANPISALYIWEGGLAIYGGVIGAVLGVWIFSRVKKVRMRPTMDIAGLGLLIGQCVGRWGNFMNRECHGYEVPETFLLRMGLTDKATGVTTYYHPTFLYESVWNLVGFVLIHFLSKKRKYDGQVFLLYVAWYGLGRVWIEGLRTDSLYIGSIRVSQLLAGVSFLAAVGILLYIAIVRKPDGSNLLVNQRANAEKLNEAVLEAGEG